MADSMSVVSRNANRAIDAAEPGYVHTPARKRRHLIALGLVVMALVSVYPWLAVSRHLSSSDFHTALEMSGAIIGLVTGLVFVTRFAALGNRLLLFVGLAFFVNGAEDLGHGLLAFGTEHGWVDLPASSLAHYIPGTYVSGRMMLGVLLLLAPFAPGLLGASPDPKRETIMVSLVVLLLTMLLTIIAFQIPLPRFIYPDQLISRPVDFFSALLLFVAMTLFLREYLHGRDMLTWWLTLSIAINVTGQMLMSFSGQLYDTFFDIAHVYKIFGYLTPLLGFALYQIAIVNEGRLLLKSLRESEERFRILSATAQDAIIMMDNDGRIVYWNKAAESMFGYPLEDVQGQDLHKLLAPSRYHDAFQKGFARFRNTGEGAIVGKTTELAALRKGGLEFPVEISFSSTLVADKWHAIGVLRDISERRSMERELRAAERLSVLGKVSGSIGHEIRNPLGVIDSSVYYLKMKLDDADEKTRDHLNRIHDQTGIATSIIQSLHDLVRVEEPHRERVDLAEVIKTGLELAQMPAEVMVENSVAERTCMISVDAAQLAMVVKNIAINACQAMNGKGAIRIATSRGEDDGIEIAFSDSGPGIASTDAERIFEPLFSTKAKGLGFGLALCKTIIEKHGGTITAESPEGQGACFTIRLPDFG